MSTLAFFLHLSMLALSLLQCSHVGDGIEQACLVSNSNLFLSYFDHLNAIVAIYIYVNKNVDIWGAISIKDCQVIIQKVWVWTCYDSVTFPVR